MAEISITKGSDGGNGIYGGSGTVPTNTVATLTDNFTFLWDNLTLGLEFDNAVRGGVHIGSNDGLGIDIIDGGITFNAYGGGTEGGTPAYLIGVEVDGDIIEVPLSAVGTWLKPELEAGNDVIINATANQWFVNNVGEISIGDNLSGFIGMSTNEANREFYYGSSNNAGSASGYLYGYDQPGLSELELQAIANLGVSRVNVSSGDASQPAAYISTRGTNLAIISSLQVNEQNSKIRSENISNYSEANVSNSTATITAYEDSNLSTGSITINEPSKLISILQQTNATQASTEYYTQDGYAEQYSSSGVGTSRAIIYAYAGIADDPTMEIQSSTTDSLVEIYLTSGTLRLSVADNNTGDFIRSETYSTYYSIISNLFELVRFNQNGSVQIPQYGAGTFPGTPTYNLSVDSNGNVIETAISVPANIYNTSDSLTGNRTLTTTGYFLAYNIASGGVFYVTDFGNCDNNWTETGYYHGYSGTGSINSTQVGGLTSGNPYWQHSATDGTQTTDIENTINPAAGKSGFSVNVQKDATSGNDINSWTGEFFDGTNTLTGFYLTNSGVVANRLTGATHYLSYETTTNTFSLFGGLLSFTQAAAPVTTLNVVSLLKFTGTGSDTTQGTLTISGATNEILKRDGSGNIVGSSVITETGTELNISVPILAGDGAATAPTYSNTGDANTGIYFPAADEVGVSCGGSLVTGFNSTGLILTNAFTPTGTADATGVEGNLSHDDDYIYLKTSVGWKRAALSTF